MIPFVRETDVAYGRADPVSPLIRRVMANNPGPFTYLGTGTYIVGHGEVAVIDPGPDDPAHLAALLAATAGERIAEILVTHTHLDHSPLARPLAAATGAVVRGLPAPGVADTGFEEADQAGFRPDVRIGEGERVAGPGWTLEAMLTPGHASNHVAYALAEENALFPGDHVMGWSTTVISPPDGDMADYLASLEKVRARGFSTLWPTHGPPITEVEPFLAAYREHRLERERQILGQLAAGRGRIAQMVPAMYAAVSPRLHPAAAHSVWAHLIKLVREGRVACEAAPELGSAYRLAD
ncbi:MAG TPA: MBL fold metallo-hydrolase [Caulobacteraceae bacterium]|jgi:glyoxylase-like metal-dependent hydrolase (beta-lactamase superfamily II)|nr:MBL fold metallo-hydrolase [Caulobacteraceae bacterium]